MFVCLFGRDDIYIAFLPLAHVLELLSENTMMLFGIRVGYSSPNTMTDMSTKVGGEEEEEEGGGGGRRRRRRRRREEGGGRRRWKWEGGDFLLCSLQYLKCIMVFSYISVK